MLADWEIDEGICNEFYDNYKAFMEHLGSEDFLPTKSKIMNQGLAFKKLIGVDWEHKILYSTE